MGAVAGGGGSLVCSHAICAGVNGSTGASSSVDISPEDGGERARVERGGVSSATAGDLLRCAPVWRSSEVPEESGRESRRTAAWPGSSALPEESRTASDAVRRRRQK